MPSKRDQQHAAKQMLREPGEPTAYFDDRDCKAAILALGPVCDRAEAVAKAVEAERGRLNWLLDNALVIHMRHGVPALTTMDVEGIDRARTVTGEGGEG